MEINESAKRPMPSSNELSVGTTHSFKFSRKNYDSRVPNKSAVLADTCEIDRYTKVAHHAVGEAQLKLQKELSEAIRKENVGRIKELVDLGVDVNGSDPSTGYLFLASSVSGMCPRDAYRELILQGASLVAESGDVGTALHAAVSTCNFETARILVLAGSDPRQIRSSDGFSALDLTALQDPEAAQYWSSELEICRKLSLERQT